jgi:hypothetical protein
MEKVMEKKGRKKNRKKKKKKKNKQLEQGPSQKNSKNQTKQKTMRALPIRGHEQRSLRHKPLGKRAKMQTLQTGFEPARAEHTTADVSPSEGGIEPSINGLAVHLLNHSDTATRLPLLIKNK